jgi:hypothetical protein
MYIGIYVKYTLVKRFLKNTQISNLMKIHPVEAELFQVVRQMDRHDEAFLQFCEHA